MGVAQKTMFYISDRLAKFFGISEAPMEHNAIAKSKQTFFYKLGINGPGLIGKCLVRLVYDTMDTNVLYCVYILVFTSHYYYSGYYTEESSIIWLP